MLPEKDIWKKGTKKDLYVFVPLSTPISNSEWENN